MYAFHRSQCPDYLTDCWERLGRYDEARKLRINVIDSNGFPSFVIRKKRRGLFRPRHNHSVMTVKSSAISLAGKISRHSASIRLHPSAS